MTRIFVMPAPDKSAPEVEGQAQPRLLVRKPVGGHLRAGGEWQNLDAYWQRRINDGDVEVIDGQVEPKEPAAPPATEPGGKAGTTSKSK